MTVATAIRQGTKLLEDSAVSPPKLTAEILLSHALQKEPVFLFAHPEHELDELAWLHYGRYLHERMRGKPTQYITQKQEFYGRDFRVTPAVLIPRPETELVVEETLRWCAGGTRVADVGVGSGAIAVTLALESKARVFGSDISADALCVAQDNAAALSADVGLALGDLSSAFADNALDVLVSNPPYVSERDRAGMQREVRDHEPALALFGGETGVEVYERLFADACRVLRPEGRIVLEMGHDSLERVKALASRCWDDVSIREDLGGIPRAFSARRRP